MQVKTMFERMRRFFYKNFLLVFLVVLPTIVACFYYGIFASDIYISESKFVVRSPQKASASGLGAFLQSTGFIRAQDDVYAVHAFIQSRDALLDLQKKLNIKQIYGNKQVDYFSRYGGGFSKPTMEELNIYFARQLHLTIDTTSSITTLKVKAFTAKDAYMVNEQLIQMSESFVNTINQRAQQDLVLSSMTEVNKAKSDMKRAASALAAYRNKYGVFDTEKQSALQLQQVAKLQEQLVQTNSKLNQLRLLAPENPQIEVLESQKQTLEQQMQQQIVGVAGANNSLSSQSKEYQELLLNHTFAEKQYAAAMASLEQTKNDVSRKEVYLERVVQPNMPDEALEPRRIRKILTVFVLGLVLFGIVSMLIEGVREHRD